MGEAGPCPKGHSRGGEVTHDKPAAGTEESLDICQTNRAASTASFFSQVCGALLPLLTLRLCRSFFAPDDQNRTRRMTRDMFGDAAEEGTYQAPAAVTANDDDVRLPLLRSLHDLRSRTADLKDLQGGRLRRQALMELADQLFRLLFG